MPNPLSIDPGVGSRAKVQKIACQVDSLRLPIWLKPANRIIVTLQRLGFAFFTFHLLSVPGRKTGKLHTTPVSPFTVGRERYILSLGHTSWVKNARVAGWGVLSRGRKQARVALVEVPVEQRPAIVREFPTQVPGGVGFFVRLGVVASPDPEAFAEAAPKLALFRIDEDRGQHVAKLASSSRLQRDNSASSVRARYRHCDSDGERL